MTLPPRALAGFREAVGTDWVFVGGPDLASYLDPFDIGDGRDHAPGAAVAPATVEQVRAVLAVARRYRVPLWPVARGKNFAYGTAAPRLRGCVVLDLGRMNRILEVDEALGTALVEPGVGFFELHAELERRGGRFWASAPSQALGSVMGNALEHGVGYTPYGEHAANICGLEVMLADGALVRTGMGAVPGSREWQSFKWGYGPVLDGMFTQSSLGVVTKMGLWLMPEPEGMAGVSISVPRKNDLAALIDALRPLKLDDTINATYTLVNGVRQITGGRTRAKLYQGPGALPADLVLRLLAEQKSGWWNVTFNLFDHPAGLDWRLEKITRAFAAIPGTTIKVDRWRRGEAKQPWMRRELGVAPLGVVDWIGGRGAHTDFGPVVAPIGSRVTEQYLAIERLFEAHGIDCWFGAFGLGGRALVMVADMIFDRDDADAVRRVKALYAALARDAAARGVGVYRAHLAFMDDAATAFSFNDGALGALNRRLKAALDPDGILAPGKQGIWPTDASA